MHFLLAGLYLYLTNNLKDAKSGVLREGGKAVDISLANCYTLADVVRELVGLVAFNPP